MLRIKYERLRAGWDHKFVGRLSGLPQPTISLIEQGRLVPTDDELERIARVLKVTPPSALLKPVVLAEEVAR